MDTRILGDVGQEPFEIGNTTEAQAAVDTERRETLLTRWFLALTLLATIAWWVGLSATDRLAEITLGNAFAGEARWLLLLGDAFFAGVLPVFGLILLRYRSGLLAPLLWVHFGGQAYAFLVSIVGAVLDPAACYGAYVMMLSAGAALTFAMRHGRVPILWGPFRFQDSSTSDVNSNLRKTLFQTVGMWIVFFLGFPTGMTAFERAVGWRLLPSVSPVLLASSMVIFVVLGAIGVTSGVEMAKQGAGTPLPSEGTQKLVVSGPYAYVRNPMALLAVLQGVALGAALNSGLTVVYSVMGGIAWELLVRPLEEEHLSNKFGGEYEAYLERVRCWIPNLHRIRP